MANNFCVYCGAKLKNNSKFCTICGRPLDGAQDQPAIDIVNMSTVALDSTTASDTSTEKRLPALAYTPINPMAMQTPGRPVTKHSTGSTVAKYIVIGVLACSVIALAAVLLILHPWSNGSEKGTLPQDSQKSSVSSAAANDSGAESQSSGLSSTDESGSAAAAAAASGTGDNDEIFDKLLAAYDGLSDYDQRIRDCASVYNSDYTSASMSQRQEDADTCNVLLEDIQASITYLDSLAITSSSKYYDDYQNISRLQNDLLRRISVIIDSWRIDLKYSSPADHTAAINAPIAAQNDSNGVNIYKKDFDELYQSAEPTKK